MASIYTHYRFNKNIIPHLDGEVRNLAENFQEEFLFGAQGPDLFFFNTNPIFLINKLGPKIHNAPFTDYINHNLDFLNKSPNAQAYFLGSALHFILDSKIHPYVEKLKSSSFSHIEIETELDRFFMLEDNIVPSEFIQSSILPTDISDAVLSSYISYGVNKKNIQNSINGFKQIKNILHNPTPSKEIFLTKSMRIIGLKYFSGLITKIEPIAESKFTNPILVREYDLAFKQAPYLLTNLYSHLLFGLELVDDFRLNYMGL